MAWQTDQERIEKKGMAPVVPTQPTGEDRTWQPGAGFRNTGAFRERAMQAEQLKAGAAQVGEPTSFRGGAGAPEPIGVTRGMTTTFSPGRLPGQQFAQPEMATPLQAQQTWNQGMRGQAVAAGDRRGFTIPEATLDTQYGGFRAPGTALAEVKGEQWKAAAAAENKRPDLVAQQKAIELKTAQTLADQNKKTWSEGFQQAHGKWNPEKQKPEVKMDESLYRIQQKAHSLLDQGQSIEAVNKAIEPDIHRHFYTPENVLGAINLFQQKNGVSLPPQTVTDLQSGHPEAMAKLYPWIKEYLNQPKPGFWERNLGVQPRGAGFVGAPETEIVGP